MLDQLRTGSEFHVMRSFTQIYSTNRRAASRLRVLVACLSLSILGFNPRPVLLRFVVHKVALQPVSFRCHSPVPHSHSFIYNLTLHYQMTVQLRSTLSGWWNQWK